MKIQEKIRRVIEQVLEELGLPQVEFAVERPRDEGHGDWATNVALKVRNGDQVSGFGFQNPREMAEEMRKRIQDSGFRIQEIKTVEVAGPGFINFYLNDKYLLTELKQVLQDRDKYGQGNWGRNKLAIVEYSSPNIAKPFTIGHLRSTIIGDAIANLLEAGGWKVLRDNHVGDWGTQFGKLLCAIEKWGEIEEIEKSERPVKKLVELYVRFHKEAEKDPKLEDEGRAWFKRLEKGDEEARRLWQKCVDWSWREFEQIYELLGVKFSQEFNHGRGLGESFFEDKMEAVVAELRAKGLLKEGKEGAKLVFFPEAMGLPPLMILKKDGASLYATRDLATDKYRLKYRPDLVVNEVGAEQSLYFRQIFEIEYELGWYGRDQRVHVGHGLYRFKEGKMSTRKGNVIWLEEVLKEAMERAKKIMKEKVPPTLATNSRQTEDGMTSQVYKNLLGSSSPEEVAEVVGIGALKWNDLKGEPRREIVFDWDKVLAMEGNSGPYLQYTYARGRSVLRKVENPDLSGSSLFARQRRDDKSAMKSVADLSNSKLSEGERRVVKWLVRYPEVVEEAGKEFAPYKLANYLYELASRYNQFYNQCRIIGDEREGVRVAITAAVTQVLKNGLGLLGIGVVEEM